MKTKHILSIGVIALSVLIIGLTIVKAQTTGTNTLNGWAWSSNIGWISFNSADNGAGGGPYSVSVDSSGNFSGYAWSPNIGWVSFNSSDLSGCSGAFGAHVSTTTGSVTGWARAIAGVGRTDGWDGCIELSGTNHTTGDSTGNNGVTYIPSTGSFTGFAWGSNVVGWLNLTGVTCLNNCSDNNNNNGGTVSLGACSTSYNSTSNTITWTANVISGSSPYAYTWNGVIGNSSITTPASQGTNSITLVVTDNNSSSGSFICSTSVSGGNQNNTSSLNLYIGTNINSTNKNLPIPQGNTFVLNWNISPDLAASTCSVSTSPSTTWIGSSGTWDDAVKSATNLSNITTTGKGIGLYRLYMSCADSTNHGTTTESVVLRLTRSGIHEE